MSSDRLQEAIDYIQSEKLAEAKVILLEMVKQPFPYADSWFMLMHCLPTKRQKIWCLEECLKVKRDHEEALKMLEYLDPDHQFYSGEAFKIIKEKRSDPDGESEPMSWIVILATVGSVLLLTTVVILVFSY